jgi:protein O-GlcNAc transferase
MPVRPRQQKPFKKAPFDVAAAFAEAMSFHRAGRIADAEAVYRKIVATQPDHFDSLHLLGVALHQRGDHAGAVRQIDAALAVNPKSVSAFSNRGSALKALGRLDEALASYDSALAIKADHPEVLFNRGTILQELGRADAALASFDSALAVKPAYPDAHINRGSLLQNLGRYDDALASYDRAIRLNPGAMQAHNNRGTVLKRLERTTEALDAYDKAIALKQGYAEAHYNRGQLLRDARRLDEALASFDRAVALKSDYAEAFYSRGGALRELGRYDEALACFERAIALRPGQKYLDGAHLYAKLHVCDWRNFDDACSHLISAVRTGGTVTSPFTLLATPSTPLDQRKCAEIYVGDMFPAPPAPMWRGERYHHDRIRVAYLSADFHDHVTAHLMAGLFESHDRTRFETMAVSFGPDKDGDMRRRLKRSFDRFVDVRADSERAIAELVRDLEIDIAVDLKGFTHGSRAGIFARRPAPVQVSYLGFPGTMGADFIDYILVDPFVVPPDRRDAFTEKLVHLPDSYYPTSYHANEAYGGTRHPTPSRTDAGLPEDSFVFCSFNNTYKITPDVFDIWMRLLRQVDGSVLWLLEANSAAPDNLRREAIKRGVASERLVFAPLVDIADHLARQRLADLFLDTFPVNAHTTASDALWVGLPLITCPGTTFVSRVAGSLLNAVGLPELITGSPVDYETLALKLARNPNELAALKQKLIARRDICAAFDTERLTRHIEAAYITMWERSQHGEAPRSFSIAPIPSGLPG